MQSGNSGQGAGPEDVVVTIEATANYWNELVWVLISRGCRVYLAHRKKAHDLRKFYAVHTKTDVTDSEAACADGSSPPVPVVS